MTTVTIKPLPEKYKKIPARLLPGIPPIFTGTGPVTDAESELARELFSILDLDSKDWYRRNAPRLFEGL